MSKIFQHINRSLEWWIKLCTGRVQSEDLDEEHYRQRILAITCLFWLLIVIGLMVVTPLIIDLTPEGSLAAAIMFLATGASVLVSMLVLRRTDNRILALHILLLVYTAAFAGACLYFGGTRSPTYALLLLGPVMAGIAGSIGATVFWGLLVMLTWIVILMLERTGLQFEQIIAPQNYNITIALAYAGMGLAVTSIIMAYAEMNKQLRTTLKKANVELGYLSSHDDLTGLYNRRFYDQRMARSLETAREMSKPLGLVMLDLDGFKKINDTYGHGVGDILLSNLGRRLRNQVRETDLIARLGGDEFAVILENIHSLEEVQAIAQKVLASVEQPLMVRNKRLALKASCGIALYPDHGDSQKAIEEQADSAMYAAKHSSASVVISVAS